MSPEYVPGWRAFVELVDNEELDLGLELASEVGADTGPMLRLSTSSRRTDSYAVMIKRKIPSFAKAVTANAGRITRQDVI